MKNLNIFCVIFVSVLLITHLSSCQNSQTNVSETVVPSIVETPYYTIFSTEGESYLELKEAPSNEGEYGGLVDYYLYFSSINEMKERMLQGELTELQHSALRQFSKISGAVSETGKIKVPDFNELYDLDLEYGEIERVGMLGENYRFDIVMDSGYNGNVYLCSETAFAADIQNEYANVIEKRDALTIERRTVQDQNVEEIIRTREQIKSKTLIYSVTNQFGTYTIFEYYVLENEISDACNEYIPIWCMMFLEADNGCYAKIYLSSFNERPSVDELTSIGIKAFSGNPSDNLVTE